MSNLAMNELSVHCILYLYNLKGAKILLKFNLNVYVEFDKDAR